MSNECEIFLVWCSFFTFTPDFCTTRLDSGKKLSQYNLQKLQKLDIKLPAIVRMFYEMIFFLVKVNSK